MINLLNRFRAQLCSSLYLKSSLTKSDNNFLMWCSNHPTWNAASSALASTEPADQKSSAPKKDKQLGYGMDWCMRVRSRCSQGDRQMTTETKRTRLNKKCGEAQRAGVSLARACLWPPYRLSESYLDRIEHSDYWNYFRLYWMIDCKIQRLLCIRRTSLIKTQSLLNYNLNLNKNRD